MSDCADRWPATFRKKIAKVQLKLQPIWPDGRREKNSWGDGGHWTLPGFSRPVSVSRLEALFLFNLAAALRARNAFEIGTGFGYSSLWLGAGISHCQLSSGWLGSLESQEEGGIGSKGLEFARWASRVMGLSEVVEYFKGHSPEDVPSCVESKSLDLVFIDGNHHGTQPLRDYLGVRAFLASRAVVIWHDVEERYGVPSAVAKSSEDGFQIQILDTSCRIAVCYRSSATEQAIKQASAASAAGQLIRQMGGEYES